MADGPLTGRRVLVTGGGRGIGAAIVERLMADGAAVVLTYRRDVEAARAIGAAGALRLDLAEPDSVDAVVDGAVGILGGLDGIVSNAGTASRGKAVADTDLAELQRALSVHAVGPHRLCHAGLPHLRAADRSDIVFVSSVAAHAPMAGGAPYVMGKLAVEGLARVLAREERAHGVRVNVVAPGLVDTEMGRRLVRATTGITDIRDLDAASPFGRVCAPADVADVVGFLLSPAGAYVNDQRIAIDGGTF